MQKDVSEISHEQSICDVLLQVYAYPEVGKVLLHEAVDLAHWETACLAVLQCHCNQTTTGQRKTGNNRLPILSHRAFFWSSNLGPIS